MRSNKFGIRIAASVLALAVSYGAQAVTDEDIMNDHKTPGDIVSYGMGTQGQRFSTLDDLTTKNIQYLQPVWAFSFGSEKMRGQESQPMIKDGVMYVTASYSRVYAIDARTGEEIWQYDARLPDGIMPCCDVVNRGVALYDDKVIFGTLDAKLVALDKDTGKPVWIKEVADYQAGYAITAAPIVVKGKLITGVSGGEFGIVGKVEAYDPNTGEKLWTPRPLRAIWVMFTRMARPSKTAFPAARPVSPGLAICGKMAARLRGLAAPTTGPPIPCSSVPATRRPGTRTCARGITCSRHPVWPLIRTTAHDGWDYDGVNELISFDYQENGKTIHAAATADRNGFFYVLNRENGDFIRGFPFVDKITWAKGLDPETGRPIFAEGGRPGDPSATEGTKGEPVVAQPAFLGGKNWMPMAFNQETGLFYVPSNEWSMDIWNEPVSYKKGAAYLGAGFTIKPTNDDYIGVLRAIDPKTGKEVWRYENTAPLWGGVMTTAGNLVFTGTPEGYLKAFDARTGEELYKFNTGSGVVGTPVTWSMDGEQYVSVASGWGGAVPLWGGEVAKVVKDFNQGGMVWTFKLPKDRVASN